MMDSRKKISVSEKKLGMDNKERELKMTCNVIIKTTTYII